MAVLVRPDWARPEWARPSDGPRARLAQVNGDQLPDRETSPMRFGDIVALSVYGTTGLLAGRADLEALEVAIRHNLPVLREFRQIMVATNYAGVDRGALSDANVRLWQSFFPDVVLMDSTINRGHSIGTSDLDNALFDSCKSSGVPWLCKGANDLLLDDSLLDVNVREAQFHYLNAVSYAALRQNDFDLTKFGSGFLYPQTTFYAIDVEATDYLVDKESLERSGRIVQRIPDYNGRIWEYIPRWSCEYLLRQCVLRNGLTTSHLVNDAQWQQVMRVVVERQIEDCSFKGLRINGICHAQGLADPSEALTVVP